VIRAKPTIRHPVMYYFAGFGLTTILMWVSSFLWTFGVYLICTIYYKTAEEAIDASMSIGLDYMLLPLLIGCGYSVFVLRRWIYSAAKVDEAAKRQGSA
jgi:hypothetical protein